MIYITYSLIKKKLYQKEGFQKGIKKIKHLVRQKKYFFFVLIFFFVFQFIYQGSILASSKTLIDTDPYVLVGYTYNYFNYQNITGLGPSYPPGFNIFTAACLSLLILPDFKVIYFFFKFAPLCVLFLFFFIISIIVDRLFSKAYFLLIIFPLVLSSSWLIFRFNYFVSSNIATILVVISLIIFINGISLYNVAFFLSIIFFFNPVVCFFYLIVLFAFLILKLITSRFKCNIIQSLKKFSKFIIIILIQIEAYLILIYIRNYDIAMILKYYLGFFQADSPQNLIKTEFIPLINLETFYRSILNFLTRWVETDLPYERSYLKYNNVIYSPFFLLAVGALFFPISKYNKIGKINQNFIIFGKVIVIFTILFYFVPIILPNIIYTKVIPFWMYIRPLQPFTAPILLMECIAFDYIIFKSNKNRIYSIFKTNLENFLNIIIVKRKHKIRLYNFDKIVMSLIIFVSFASLFIYIERDDYNLSLNYHYKDEQLASLFFIKENLPKDSILLVANITYSPANNWIYDLIIDYEYIIWDFSGFNSYNTTKSYIFELNKYSSTEINYLLIDLKLISNTELVNFLEDPIFKIIYENRINIILKVSDLT